MIRFDHTTEKMSGKTNKSKFDKVLSTKDIFVLAFGAMIGWGWVVNTGIWIETAGALGAAIAFLIGGVMVLIRRADLC